MDIYVSRPCPCRVQRHFEVACDFGFRVCPLLRIPSLPKPEPREFQGIVQAPGYGPLALLLGGGSLVSLSSPISRQLWALCHPQLGCLTPRMEGKLHYPGRASVSHNPDLLQLLPGSETVNGSASSSCTALVIASTTEKHSAMHSL